MSSLTEIQFYWWKEGDKICVQNFISCYRGQYHEHTVADFEKWKKTVNPKYLHKIEELERTEEKADGKGS